MIFFFYLVCIALFFSSLTNKEIPKFPHYLHHGRPKKCWKISCLAGSVRNVLIAKNFFYKHFKAKSLTIGLKDDDDKGDDRLDDTELQGPLLAEPAAINLASINQSASRTCTNESGINQSINQSTELAPINLIIQIICLQNLNQWIFYPSINQSCRTCNKESCTGINQSACRTCTYESCINQSISLKNLQQESCIYQSIYLLAEL